MSFLFVCSLLLWTMRYSSFILVYKCISVLAAPYTLDALTVITKHKHYPEPGSPEFYWKLAISAVLVLSGGAFAGYALFEWSR